MSFEERAGQLGNFGVESGGQETRGMNWRRLGKRREEFKDRELCE